MPDGDKIILVTDATGKQGGAVARHLLSARDIFYVLIRQLILRI